jgi:hypothetical protein
MHEMPDRFDERDLDAMLDGREPSGLDNRFDPAGLGRIEAT